MTEVALLITCEHGGNQVPPAYAHLFKDHQDLLTTHAGYDIGALGLAHILGRELADAYFFSTTTRLLVELNRSLHHKNLFSSITKTLPTTEKQKIIAEHYLPYRNAVLEQIKNWHKEGKAILHISVHSFTPIWGEQSRNADIGFLYDPKRLAEKLTVQIWQQDFISIAPHLRTRLNYPYRGIGDGFTTYLRKNFLTQYAGIELEVNQGLLKDPGPVADKLAIAIKDSIAILKTKARFD